MATAGSVGLLLSLEHKCPKTFIGLFKTGATLSFEGCTQIRMLAGALEIEGHVIKPATTFQTLYSSTTSARIVISSLSPESHDHTVVNYLKPLQRKPVCLLDRNSETPEAFAEDCVTLDLSYEDVQQIRDVLNSSEWQKTHLSAIALLRETDNTLLQALLCHHATQSTFDTIRYMTQSCPMRNLKLITRLDIGVIIPDSYRQIAMDIATIANSVVLVCGEQNSGKSTLCRVLINHLLNRFPAVSFLECDVGQSEFTVSGVVALHCLSEPVFGPSFVHLQNPEKAFVFGDTSPKFQPDFYINLIQLCIEHYRCHVITQQNYKGCPLVVNTCGWVQGLGIPLFLDIVRTVSPTFIIQLLHSPSIYSNDVSSSLPPLTPQFLSSSPGLRLKQEQMPQPQQLVSDIGFFSCSNLDTLKSLRSQGTSSPILVSSATEEDEGESSGNESDCVELNEVLQINDETGVVSRKRLQTGSRSTGGKKPRFDLNIDREVGSVVEREWSSSLQCKLYLMRSFMNNSRTAKKNAPLHRLLGYVAYFSPLLESLSPRQSRIKSNFIMAATPYQIPWERIAVHCIHKKVPCSQVLYAINGKFVSLARVKEEEIINQGDGTIKIIKSFLPKAEFLGLGLVRGIDPVKRLFFVTTPESLRQLSRVNCLILGNSERPSDLISQHHVLSQCPYILQHFQHKNYGRLGWTVS